MEQQTHFTDESEFQNATRPAIEFLQKHGLAMSTIIIQWDRAILESVDMSYGLPVPD